MASKKVKRRNLSELTELLGDWLTFNEELNTLDEDAAKTLLMHEMSNKRRESFALRLYGRYSRMRSIREKKELRAKLLEK